MYWSLHRLGELTEADYERCVALMEPERRRSVLSVTHEQTRRMTVLGEWVVKRKLAARFGRPVEDIALVRTPQGKPYVQGLPMQFSLSHTGTYLAAAFDTTPVGVDAELVRPVSQRLAQRICTRSDWDYLSQGRDFDPQDEGQRRRFFEIWTAKEAWFKREGTGITRLRGLDYAPIPVRHIWQDELLVTLVTAEA